MVPLMRKPLGTAALAGTLLIVFHPGLAAQSHESMQGMEGMLVTPLGIPMERLASGTTWLPDASPLSSLHRRLGGWDVTGHGLVFAQYTTQSGTRGDHQLGSLNWAMLMASHPVGGGLLQLRTMLSLDALGVTRRGYPLLLQSGESFEGVPLHDRQHPHDFWMELGALFLQPVSTGTAIELYVAPSGEPALGPVAFMHRPSAFDNPFAPIGHHWQDATHISFGVVTAGVFSREVKLEASAFNGREPDDRRWGFDFNSLDSYSGRLTWNPAPAWSMTAGFGHIRETEHSLNRITASVLHGTSLGAAGRLASTLVYGGNRLTDQGGWAHSLLFESEAKVHDNTLFGRIEWVEKSAHDLGVGPSETKLFDVGAASLGYIRELGSSHGITLGLGGQGSVNLVPPPLESFYGTRRPLGGAVFLRIGLAVRGQPIMEMPGMK